MHLLAFVSHVASDIITPALDSRFGIQRVSLLCQRDDLALAYDIAAVCRNLHLTASVIILPPDSQPLALRQRLAELIQGAVTFNISAATPVQAAFAYELARQRHLPVLSVEPRHDRLIWLSGGEHSPLHNGSEIADGLSLEGYFGLYGSSVLAMHYRLQRRNPHYETLAAALASRAASHPRDLSLLNRLCNEIDAAQYSEKSLPPGEGSLREWLEQCGLVNVNEGGHVRCNDARARFFLAGGWLEVWMLAQVASLAAILPISDAAVGVKISHNGVENEYDVAILCNNHLYLVECKTVAPTSHHQRGVGLDNLFKLDSAANLGGLHARAMLASLYPPTESEAGRAQVQGIAMLYGAQLPQAAAYLQEWLCCP